MRFVRHSLFLALTVLAMITGWSGVALAVDAVRVDRGTLAIDLTPAIEYYRSDGETIQISTAPGRDGIVRRIAVTARESGARPDWIVFALTNETNEQLERLLVAPHFRLVGSGVVWPDLGASRIAAITASQGIRPDRDSGAAADVFRITIDPGATITYVAELRTPTIPQVYLWEPNAYRDKVNGLTLYKGNHHRHCRSSGTVPDRRLRGEGRGDLPRCRRSRLGGCWPMPALISASSSVFPRR